MQIRTETDLFQACNSPPTLTSPWSTINWKHTPTFWIWRKWSDILEEHRACSLTLIVTMADNTGQNTLTQRKHLTCSEVRRKVLPSQFQMSMGMESGLARSMTCTFMHKWLLSSYPGLPHSLISQILTCSALMKHRSKNPGVAIRLKKRVAGRGKTILYSVPETPETQARSMNNNDNQNTLLESTSPPAL